MTANVLTLKQRKYGFFGEQPVTTKYRQNEKHFWYDRSVTFPSHGSYVEVRVRVRFIRSHEISFWWKKVLLLLEIINVCQSYWARSWYMLDVCPSVRPSHAGIVSKWLNLSSIFRQDFVLTGFRFDTPITRSLPNRTSFHARENRNSKARSP